MELIILRIDCQWKEGKVRNILECVMQSFCFSFLSVSLQIIYDLHKAEDCWNRTDSSSPRFVCRSAALFQYMLQWQTDEIPELSRWRIDSDPWHNAHFAFTNSYIQKNKNVQVRSCWRYVFFTIFNIILTYSSRKVTKNNEISIYKFHLLHFT